MTCRALLVLLCFCLAETRAASENDITQALGRDNEAMGAAQRPEAAATASSQQTCQPDIHTVLREMSILMTEQRVELGYTKTQVEALETRLRASEKVAEQQRVELTQTEARLATSERQVEQLKSEYKAVAVSLNLTGNQVEELRKEREERRVSFSASLLTSGAANTGPFSAGTVLVYRNVLTNIGSAYNANTGVFTAPVRGVYYFVVFMHGSGRTSTAAAVALHKNGQHVVITWSHLSSGFSGSSNGASLLLDVGDVVYVVLRANAWVYDDAERYTTFSGHLLFPM